MRGKTQRRKLIFFPFILSIRQCLALAMERSEPTLVPEWLKNAGSSSGGGSISHSDDQAASRVARNKRSVNSNGHDFGRPSSSERTASSYFRRSSSSNGSGNLRPYSSFGRNQRNRDWENDCYDSRDRDKSLFGDRRHRDFSDSLGNTFSSKFERDGLRRSQSMISGKRGDTWPKKVVTDLGSTSENNNSGLLTKGCLVGGVKKATFEKDFPSLGASDEKSAIPEVGRVPSPGLSSAIQSLPIGSSVTIGGEKWTSALAEVPVIVGSDGSSILSVQQAVPSSTMPMTVGTTTTLNMAETVAQGPSRAQAAPQLPIGTQRLEELALKQSRQLIPVTPSTPKALGLNSSDKQKIKVGHQHHPVASLPMNHSLRGGPVKADVSKASNMGKLQFLKPVREKNGTTPFIKDTPGSKVVNATAATAATASGSAAARGPLNNVPADRKPVLTVLEKRPTSQAKSRNDFFNLVRKKSMSITSVVDPAIANSSSVHDTGIPESPSFSDKHDSDTPERGELPSGISPSGDHFSEQRCDLNCNGDACDMQKCVSNGGKHSSIHSEEEETAFLRSLGWEENEDEGGLTEEEIKGFYTKYINSRPSLKILRGVEPKFLSPILSSSDAKLES